MIVAWREHSTKRAVKERVVHCIYGRADRAASLPVEALDPLVDLHLYH